ncbi:peptide chain release factor 2 [Candidatus Gromoviella agglomerans]|uniref:peptide chain release factor 2 n=1 Tax=Candidatus Gromoviella agglomerans TaxID=2806609 RepID=UPI00236871A9|nr:peptide chain release factor 2 [Candidatus Gromoviella agglomerans]UFX98399.1 Peptide chain release factor 2 [Candidatus Gromoviella agglomerans]
MKIEIKDILNEVKKTLNMMSNSLNINQKTETLTSLQDTLSDPSLWDNPSQAISLSKEVDYLQKTISMYNNFRKSLEDIEQFLEMDDSDEFINNLYSDAETLLAQVKRSSIICFLSSEGDDCNCFLEINSGAGGTEAQDWTEMLSNMYIKWAEKSGYSVEIVNQLKGEEAGIKNICIKIINQSSTHAYGWLKFESGVHRLVRISPFDSSSRRHTSFSSVWAYPEIDDSIEIQIQEKDLRIDTFRASGAGGQHVNKTDSAIRITHIPTNIVVQCQDDRSQHKNKAEAMKMLKSRLYQIELEKKMSDLQKKNSSKKNIEWGNQIRSYVLQPYQMVKDNRTNLERSDAQNILNGDISEFLEKALENGLQTN